MLVRGRTENTNKAFAVGMSAPHLRRSHVRAIDRRMTIAVKICGISNEEALEAAIEAGADYAGFVFYPPSPRNLSLKRAKELARLAGGKIKTVALTVNARNGTLKAIVDEIEPAFLQLHGRETRVRTGNIRNLAKTGIIKAIKVASPADVSCAGEFEEISDFLLFDAKAPVRPGALPGGNGLSFDWSMLAGASLRADFMLSGGLNAGNVLEALKTSGARAIDVSSGVETAPGVKSPALIEEFVRTAKSFSRGKDPSQRAYKEKNHAARF